MRILAFVFVLLLALAGPVVYLTLGREGLAHRREHLAELKQAHGEIALLQSHAPMTDAELDAIEIDLAERRAAIAGVIDALAAEPATPAPDDGALRELGQKARVDAALLDPLLASLAGAEAEDVRRRALHAFLTATAENPPVRVEALHLAVAPSPLGGALLPADAGQLISISLEVTLLAQATPLVDLLEQTLEAAGPGDLSALDLRRPTPEEWDRLPATWPATSVPMRAKATLVWPARKAGP